MNSVADRYIKSKSPGADLPRPRIDGKEITIKEASELTGKHKTTILRAINSERLPIARGSNSGEHIIYEEDVLKLWPKAVSTKVDDFDYANVQQLSELQNRMDKLQEQHQAEIEELTSSYEHEIGHLRTIADGRQARIEEQRKVMHRLHDAMDRVADGNRTSGELQSDVKELVEELKEKKNKKWWQIG